MTSDGFAFSPPLVFSRRDYQGEHICADTLFSCHQLDEQSYYHDPEHRPYGIATM